MNRKQRQVEIFRLMAIKATDRNLEMSTTFVLAAVVLAMDRAHCKVNWDKWFQYFTEIYPELIHSEQPMDYVHKAGDIIGGDIEIYWTE